MKVSKDFIEKNEKVDKGITLIALVITIVVLLILSAIAINEINGNGIITKAKETANKHETEKNIEKIKLAVYEYKIKRDSGEVDNTCVQDEFGDDNVKGSNGSYIITINGDEYLVDNYSNIIKKDPDKKLIYFEVEESAMLDEPFATLNTYIVQVDGGDKITFSDDSVMLNGEVIVTGTLTEEAEEDDWWMDGWEIKNDDDEYESIDEEYTIIKDLTVLRLISGDSCIAKGSKITMGDGTVKNVEDLVPNDIIMTYDFFTGTLAPKRLVATIKGENENINVINIALENGTILKILSTEDIYNIDDHKFFTVSKSTYKEIIGKNVMVYNNGKKDSSKVVNAYITKESMEYYTVYSSKSLNYFANGILARFTSCYTNLIYKITDDDIIDAEQLNSDVEKYGLYKLDDFGDIATEEEFYDFDLRYLKILEGRGIATKEEILEACSELTLELREAKEIFENKK